MLLNFQRPRSYFELWLWPQRSKACPGVLKWTTSKLLLDAEQSLKPSFELLACRIFKCPPIPPKSPLSSISQAGRYAISHDISYHEHRMNILGSLGFCNALFQCLRLLPGGGKLTAPVCSSWVFLYGTKLMHATHMKCFS